MAFPAMVIVRNRCLGCGAAAALVSGRVARSALLGKKRRLGARAGFNIFFAVDVMILVAMIGPVPPEGLAGFD